MTTESDKISARVEMTGDNIEESDESIGDECEEDYKEPREEELSLIAHSDSRDNLPVPIIRSPRHKHFSSGSKILQTNPNHVHSCSEIDIQIATDADISHDERRCSLALPSFSSSSIKTLCGPNPSKIALVCLLVISVWTMLVLVIHLDKKLSLTTETLEMTQSKMKLLQDTALSNRRQTNRQMHGIDRKLERMWKLLKSNQSSSSSSSTEKSSISSTSQSPPSSTVANTFFDDGDSSDWSW